MKSLKRIIPSILLIVALFLSLFIPSYAAGGTAPATYSKEYNSGTRDVVCTTLNGTSASSYYANYNYDDLSALSKGDLFTKLQTLMRNTHKYTSSYDDCHYKADKTDCQNEDGSVSLIYTNYSATMSQWNGWNREHVWPKSLGGDTTTGGGADLHHIRPSDAVVNSTRNNKLYGNVSGGTEVYGKKPATGYLGGSYGGNYFEPLDNVKGDVARICLYVYVRWNSSWGAADITDVFQSVDVLLEWCEMDPVDTWEMGRNEVIQNIQGNRNVFIDYPEYAWLIFGREVPDDMVTPSGEAMGGNTSGGSSACSHSNKTTSTVAATCTTTGLTTITCADCGSVISKNVVAATGHNYVDGTCSMCGNVSGSAGSGSGETITGEVTLTFDDTSKRTVYNSSQQVWTENGITLTNDKSSSTTSVADYADPARFYKNSDITVKYPGITKIVLNCPESKYSTAPSGLTGATVSKSGTAITITLDSPQDSYTFTSNGSQLRVDKITVYYEVSSSCEHANTSFSTVGATCTVAGAITETCDDCREVVSVEEIPATGHQNTSEATVEATCTEAGSVTVTCDDCGAEVSKTTITALGHSYTNGVCSICGNVSGSTEPDSGSTGNGEVTLTFDDTSKRTVYNSNQQVWTENGITLTNDKSSSTTSVADYASPARFYKNSKITVEYTGMTKIVFTCNSSSYANDLADAIPDSGNYTVVTSGQNVTVSFVEKVDTFVISSLSIGQVRMDSLTVTYEQTVVDPDCEHTNTTTTTVDATCTVAGSITVTCDDCGATVSTTPIVATGHQNTSEATVKATCTVAGSITVTCDDCGATVSTTPIAATGHRNTSEAAVNATCTEAGYITVTCDDCDATVSTVEIPATGHSYVDGTCSKCGEAQGSIGTGETITSGITIKDYADANGWTNGTKYLSVILDDNITVSVSGGSYTGNYYTSGENWRVYQNESPSIVVSAENGCIISTVTITYSVSNTGVLTLNGSNITSGTAVNVNDTSITFSVGNTGSATNGQVRITAIEVVYEEPAACAHANTTTTTVDATCTVAGSTTVTCDDCGATVSTTPIAATGHNYVDGVCTKCYDDINGVPVAEFKVPDGASVVASQNGPSITLPAEPVLPSSIEYAKAYTFIGWTTAPQNNVSVQPTIYTPGDTVVIDDDTTFYAVYSYAETSTSTVSGYIKTDLADIKSTDKVVITMAMANGSTVYALTSANGTSAAPTAVIVTVDGNALSGTVDAALLWNISNSSGNLTIYPDGTTSKWLYCTASNNGVRVGTSANKVFTIDSSSGYLKNTATSRYVGVYTANPDWRCYTSTSTNIGNQTLAFYVLTDREVSTEVVCYTTTLEYTPGFTGASLNIGKDLSIRYHAVLGDNAENYTVRFTMNDKVVIVGGVEEDGKYVFSFCGIAPQCMGDTVKAELLLNGEVVSIKESYSVKAYVEGAIELYSGDEKLMRLLADLLYYGEAAQEYLGYKTDALVTAGVTDLLEASDVAPTNEDNNKSIAPNKDEGTRFIAAGVRFDYDNKIYVKLMVVGEDNVTVTVNSETLELISLGAGVYVAYSDGISALHFDEKIVFTLSVNGEESQTLTYTVNDYAYSKRSDAEIGELSLALYRYGKSAQDYNGSN